MFRLTTRNHAAVATGFVGTRAGLPNHHLPAGSNLSTLTAMGLGLLPQAQSGNILNSALATAGATSSSSSSAAAAAISMSFHSSYDTSSNGAGTLTFFPPTYKSVDPLSWRLPSAVQLHQQQQRSGFGGFGGGSGSGFGATSSPFASSASSGDGQLRASAVRPNEALDAIQSAAHVIAPLPLDAAVLCLGIAIEGGCLASGASNSSTSFKKEVATAIWNFPAGGAGAILNRLVDVLQSRPKSVFPRFGQKGQSAEDICKVLVDVVKNIVELNTKQNNNDSAQVAAFFAQESEFFKASAKVMKLYRQVVVSSSSTLKNNNNASASVDTTTIMWFLDAAVKTIQMSSTSILHSNPNNNNNTFTSELPAFADICDLCSSELLVSHHHNHNRNIQISNKIQDSFAATLLGSFNKALYNVNQGAPFYLDTNEGVANLMMLLMACANNETNSFAENVVTLWSTLAQHTRAATSTTSYSSARRSVLLSHSSTSTSFASGTSGCAATTARSALVGALAMTNRSTEAFEHEEKLYQMGFVLDPQAQLVLIRSVTSGGNTDANATNTSSTLTRDSEKDSGEVTSSSLSNNSNHFSTNVFIMRREMNRLWACVRGRWAVDSSSANVADRKNKTKNDKNNNATAGAAANLLVKSLTVDVRLALLQLCWECDNSGRIPAALVRSFFPESFVNRLEFPISSAPTNNKKISTKIDLASIASASLSSNQHEVLCTLLRGLILLDQTERVSLNAESFASQKQEKQLQPEGDDDVAAAKNGTDSEVFAKIVQEELAMLTAAALDEVVGSSSSADSDAELWGCVVGAAAASGCRSVLVDSAMSLKTAQPDDQFVETVMLTAIECLRRRDWQFSKLVVAELARALNINSNKENADQTTNKKVLSEKVMSRLLSMQQRQQHKREVAGKQQKEAVDGQEAAMPKVNVEAIVQEFFGSA